MKKTYKNIAKLITLLLGFFVSNLYAQTNNVQILETEYNNSGQLFSIVPHPSWSATPIEGLPKILAEAYGVKDNFTFRINSIDDEGKFSITRAEQMIGNYPVDGGDFIFKRTNKGNLEVIIGTLREPASITEPVIAKENALEIALSKLNITNADYVVTNDLKITLPNIKLLYEPINGIQTNKVVLCYEVEITTTQPARWFVYVNAVSGEIEHFYNAILNANGKGHSLYSGNNLNLNSKWNGPLATFEMIDTVRKIKTIYWKNATNGANAFVPWSDSNKFYHNDYKPGVEVHINMGKTYDYFSKVHKRNSFDGSGGEIRNNYRYKTNYNNAFWDGTAMWYGKGDGAQFSDLVSLDVVGHEFSHAIIEKMAGLKYQNESGALNEAWADIFGYCIEAYSSGGGNWQIGEQCYTPGTGGDALRTMDWPNTNNNPDCYDGLYWTSQVGCVPQGDGNLPGYNDLCGVHNNSGVADYWFYLLTVGRNGTNDKGKSYKVTGIGRAKSEIIAFKALRYMTAMTDFKGARKATLLAAKDEYGEKSTEYKQVCNAWYAVNVGEKCCDTMQLEFKIKDPKCIDSKDGEIDLTVKKAVGGLVYKWYKGDTTGIVLSASQDLVGLDSGNYVVVVKDTVAKCEIMGDTNLVAPEKVKVSVSGGGAFVGACQRSFTVVLSASASGGTTPYRFNWDNARKEIVCSGSSGFFRTYTATVEDKNGCKGEANAWVMYIPITCSYDPNDIIGPPSYSDQKWVSVNATLPYKIRYENDPKFATGPAQKVTINHKLDSNTDLTSFRLSSFGFYKYSFDVPDNSSTYSKRLDLRDSFGIFLDVTAGLDIDNREAFWIFESIDPATGLPPTSGNKGYLAINDTITHKGEGFVNYTIKPKSTAKTGDSIRAKATIVFDDNPAVPTPKIFNLIDAKPPISYIKGVASLIDSTMVPMTLRGKDDTGGSGIAKYDVYVSENGGAYNLFAKEIADTQINFRGNYGSTYTAYSIASDNVDNREGDKTSPDISFSIASNEFFKPITPGTSLCTGDTLNIRWLRSFVNSVNLQYSADSGKTFTTFATNLGGTDTLYRWKIPGTISGIKKYILRSVNASNSVIIDTSDYFELKQGPVINLGPDTSFCDGTSFSLTLNPGSGYSSYKWSDSATSTTKTVSNYGTYWVKVTASTGCKSTDQIVVSKDLLPVVSSKTLTSPLCFGNTNGAIDITVVSGNAPYTYLWNNSATTQDLTNIAAGNYSVAITDKKGCNMIEATTLTQPAILTKSHAITNVKCFGGSDGAVNETITGGTTPYSYSWSNASTAEDISSLVAATYYLEVTDKNNCVIRDTSIVTQPTKLAKSYTQVNVKCYGDASGSVDLTITGGTTAYSYAWTASGGGSVPSGQSTNQDLTGLIAGDYFVTVTDANNCIIKDTVKITQPSAPLASSKTQVDVKCYGDATGSIDLTVTGGTTAYTYAWTASGGGTVPSGQATNQDLTGLVIGTYSVTVTDANNCTTTNSATITQPAAALASSKSQVNVLCYGNATGSIDLSVTGGTTGYTYAWTASGGGTVPSGQATNQDLTNLVAGTYNVTITDANNCTTTNSATITQPSAPLATSKTQVDVKCYGNATGSIDLSVTGGTTGYTYAWTASGGGVIPSGQSTNQDLTGLVAGTYNVTVTDANNCTTTNSATITQPSAPLASSKTQVDVKCYGNATGSIDLTVTGGTTAYTYAWTASGGGTVPSGQATNQDLTGLVIGTYNVTITDANNCTTTNSATITQPTQLIISNIATDVKCFAGNDGGVNVTVSGGVTPYSYSWTNGATTEDITNVVIGNYTLTVTDNNGCTIQTTGIVNQPALLVASHVISDVKCYNGSDGAINLTIAGGITPYVFAWSSSDVTEDISGKPTGTYKVTVTDKNLCVVKDSGFISQPAAPLSSTMAMSPVNCYAGNDGSADLTVAGGTSPYTFAWSNGKTTEDISGLTLGTYYVTITDFNNCQLLDTVVVTQPAAPLATTMSSLNVKCFGGNDGSADLTVTGGTKPYNFVWSNAQSTEDISGLILGKYVVTITDINLCIIKDSVTITQPAAPLSSIISQTAVKCFGGTDGGVALTVSGGTLNYSYLWSNGATTKDISNVITGKYKVTVTDGNSCILKDSIVVTQPVAPIAATHIVSNAKCKDVLNGNINLSVTGGTSPYTFAWSNGQTTEDAVNLRDGHYVVTITDANGCKLKDSADITEPDSLIISADGTTATPAVSNGFVFVTVKGGTLPYTYFWNGSASNNNDTLFRQPIGTYIIRVVDANGCEDTDTFNILEAPPTSMLRIGPNPSNGSLTVFDLEAFGLDLPIYFELIDVEGKIRMDFQIIGQDVYTFDLPDALYNNTYMLRIYNDRFEETRKIHLLR